MYFTILFFFLIRILGVVLIAFEVFSNFGFVKWIWLHSVQIHRSLEGIKAVSQTSNNKIIL